MILDFVNGHIDISPDREAFMLLFVSLDFIIFYLLSQASRDIISKWWQVASHLCLLEEQWRGVARLQRWSADKERYRLQERIHYQGGRIVNPWAGARCSGISVWFQSGLHWNPVKPQSVEPYSTGWKDERFVQIVQARLGRRRWRIQVDWFPLRNKRRNQDCNAFSLSTINGSQHVTVGLLHLSCDSMQFVLFVV